MKSKNIDFINSYHVSINCHVCNKHFDKFNKYKNHVKEHYENDPLRKWLECDIGCKENNKNKVFSSDIGFIYHIATHTNDFAFKCDVEKCNAIKGTQSDIKKHWNLKHNQKKTESELQNKQNYYVSVDCYVCHKHFYDFKTYKDHIKKHYYEDPHKEWLECDFGCKDPSNVSKVHKSSGTSAFICHIAYHTRDYPFKCIKCDHAVGTRTNFRQHWNVRHNNNQYKNVYEYSCNDSSMEALTMDQRPLIYF
eukprot:444636_1